MSGPGPDPGTWAIGVIVLAVALGVIRLLLWQRAAPVEARAPQRRLAALIALQLAAGALLHVALFPPGVATRAGTLIVATAGAPVTLERSPDDILVALPEAGAVVGAVRAPDLATALRRFPGAARLRVVGQGLAPRDQAPQTLPIDFDPPPQPRGLIDLTLPDPVVPGAAFSVGGQVGALASGAVELVDPANVVVDRVRLTAGQRFVLTSTTRTPGLALFDLRLRDPAGATVEQIALPVETRAQAQPRVRVLAGAPGPEIKYLRRWAEDAGIDLNVDLDVGAGVRLGDAPTPLTRAALGDVDLVVIDDRRWETLDAGARGALAAAVDDGLGLLLRPTGPLPAATRRDWAALGMPLIGGEDSRPLQLRPPAPPLETGGTASAPSNAEALTDLVRRDFAQQGPNAISLLRDADGMALASWRARGRGRVGVWTVTDSYALVLTGRSDRYGELWSELFSVLARAGDDNRVRINGLARAGTRLAVCGVRGAAKVVGPEGDERALRVDPATGEASCAAYWPQTSGWHLVRDGQGRETAVYVHPTDAAPSLNASANREATLALLATTPPRGPAPSVPRAPGSPWPWFAALLAVLALLWGLERHRGAPNGESPSGTRHRETPS